TGDPERREAERADPRPPERQRAEEQSEQADDDQHPDAERDLVVGAELVDGEVLQPRRGAIDELRTDGVARRLHVPEQTGDELADTEGERRGNESRKRGEQPDDPCRARAGFSISGVRALGARCDRGGRHARTTERRWERMPASRTRYGPAP